MATLTLFAYGTNENSTKTNNIISQFSKACTTRPIVVEGPGTLGREVPANAEKGAKEIINWLRSQQDDKNNINLTGFSRGSVTCIHIANQLKRLLDYLESMEDKLGPQNAKLLARLRALNINMLLLDPVAGLRNKGDDDARLIPSNVTKCVVLLSKDERRRDFKPQDQTRLILESPEKTQITMLPMPGNHSDYTKIKNEGMESGAKIAWYILHGMLNHNGTQFSQDKIPQIISSNLDCLDLPPNPSAKDLLKLFSKNHEEQGNYFRSGLTVKHTDSLPMPRTERTLNKHLEYYVKNSDFFVNQLERELFKTAYPKSFNYLFERNRADARLPDDSNSSQEAVKAELLTLQADNLSLFQDLEARGVKTEEGRIILGPPTGYNYLEPCSSMQQIFPNLLSDSVKENAEQMNKLPSLEMEVYRLTFQYQREKYSLNFFNERGESSRAIKIRKEINALVNNGEGNRDEKYQLILDTLERHLSELNLSNSSSALTIMIEQLLINHGRLYEQKQSISNAIIVGLVHASFSLIKETINLTGTLGYIGGATLFAIGNAIESLGQRMKEMIGDPGNNPFYNIGSLCANLVAGFGFLIKNGFGLKPLTKFLTNGIGDLRDTIVRAINTSTIEKVTLEAILAPDETPQGIPAPLSEEPLLAAPGKALERTTSNYFKNELKDHKNHKNHKEDKEDKEDVTLPVPKAVLATIPQRMFATAASTAPTRKDLTSADDYLENAGYKK